MSVKPELAISEKLLNRTALAPFGCEEVKIKHGKNEDNSESKLVVPKFPVEEMKDEQGPSRSGKKEERDDEEKENRLPEELMEQDIDPAGRNDDKASMVGTSSLVLYFLDNDEVGTETLAGMTEPPEDETSTLESRSTFMKLTHNCRSITSGKSKATTKKLLAESPHRRRIEGAATVPFLGTLPEEEWEVHHRDHENRTGSDMVRVAFMVEV